MPLSLLLLSRCCRCRRCHCCCRRHCYCRRHHQVVIHQAHCCHCHPSRLPLDPRSLLLPPCHHTLPPPSNYVFTVHCAHHRRPPSLLQSNAHTRCRSPLPPLLNAIFVDVTSPPPSNAVKHCRPIKFQQGEGGCVDADSLFSV